MATLSQQNSRHFFHFVLAFAACGTKREEPVIESLRSTCKVNKSRMICKLDSSYMQSLHMLCSITERSLFMTYHFLWILKRKLYIHHRSCYCWIFTARFRSSRQAREKRCLQLWCGLGTVHWGQLVIEVWKKGSAIGQSSADNIDVLSLKAF